jgi:tetratricopeptide (TPR) repeat protein
MLGYLLRQFENYLEAKNIFGKVLQWRPQEPQSYRDYALSLQQIGNTQYALDTLYKALTEHFNTEANAAYSGIEEVLVMELNQILSAHPNIDKTKIDTGLLANLPVDIRVVLNWNMNDSDMDLWVTDPRGQKVYYGNKESVIGGRIGNDFTSGYGPEQFLLRKAIKGKYIVQLHYYGDNIQKLAGGTAVQAEIYTNYGTPQQKRFFVTLQLEKGKDANGLLVGEFDFE